MSVIAFQTKIGALRKIYCLGEDDWKKILGSKEYDSFWVFKYTDARDEFKAYGNFHLLFQLNDDQLKSLFEYVGLTESNTVDFIRSIK